MEFSTEGIDELARRAQGDLSRAQDRARLLVRALRYAATEEARGRAAEALVEIGAPAVLPLVEYLKDDQVARGTGAQQVLTRIGSAAAEPLVELLGHPDPAIRTSVAWMFTSIIDPRVCPALVTALEDEDPAVRQCAAYALGDQHCFWAVPRLIELLDDLPQRIAAHEQGADDEMRFEQLRLDAGLGGHIIDDEAAQLLAESSPEPVAISHDEQDEFADVDEEADDYVGAAAAYALGTIGDARAVDRLVEIVEDPERDWLVRGQAVWALGEIGDPRAFPVVLEALDDPECEPEAVSAIGGFDDELALRVFARYYRHPQAYLRQQTVIGLRHLGGPETLPYLLALLHDPDQVVRSFSARTLGWLGDQRAVEPLLYSLRYGDERYRETVLEALEELS